MENKKTPVSTVIFYIIGIILLIVALFMLWTAVNYTKTYLSTYDASFKDMWTNSVQYVIAQFVPYLGMGVICLGLGRAIKGSANAKAEAPAAEATEETKAAEAAADAPAEEPVKAAEAPAAAAAEGAAISAAQMDELIRRIDTNREVLSIKIEEKEKRDSFRIKELEKKVEGFLSDVKYINEPLEELVYKQAAGIDDLEQLEEAPAEAPAAPAPAGPTPQIFRVARNMTAPACPVVAAAPAPAEVGPTPQIFRVARNMTAPACPAVAAAAEAAVEEAPAEVGPTPQIFRVARNMTAPACPAVAAAAAAPKAAGAVPQIFTVARRMTAPACPAAAAEAAGAVPPVFRVARTMTMTV